MFRRRSNITYATFRFKDNFGEDDLCVTQGQIGLKYFLKGENSRTAEISYKLFEDIFKGHTNEQITPKGTYLYKGRRTRVEITPSDVLLYSNMEYGVEFNSMSIRHFLLILGTDLVDSNLESILLV